MFVPGEPRTFTREVVPNAGKITATISANLATLDLPNPIDPTTPVELNTASGMPNRLAITAVDSSGNLSVLAKKILPQ